MPFDTVGVVSVLNDDIIPPPPGAGVYWPMAINLLIFLIDRTAKHPNGQFAQAESLQAAQNLQQTDQIQNNLSFRKHSYSLPHTGTLISHQSHRSSQAHIHHDELDGQLVKTFETPICSSTFLPALRWRHNSLLSLLRPGDQFAEKGAAISKGQRGQRDPGEILLSKLPGPQAGEG